MESNRRCVREWININNYHYEVVVGASEEPTKATFTYRRDKSFPFCIRHLTDSLCDGNSRGSLQCNSVKGDERVYANINKEYRVDGKARGGRGKLN